MNKNVVSYDEYEKAQEIVRKFIQQETPKTVQVSVTYKANVSVTVRVPAEWDVKKIKEELSDGYYHLYEEDVPDTDLKKMIELIIDGDEYPV